MRVVSGVNRMVAQQGAPLADLRIIAVEQYGAGPFGSLQLADLGAEVIKIEDPRFGGDVGRYVPPFQDGEDSLFFETFNRNKKSLSLDMSTVAGRKVFEDLVVHADAVYSNLRGDVPSKLRITYEDLKHLNPRIVCVSLSGFGMTGPRAAEPGYDYVLQALVGWMSLTGEPEGPPTKTGLSLVDLSGGYVAAVSLLAGVHAARRDGVGMDCDVSLYDTAVAMLNYPGTWYMTGGWEPRRTTRSSHPSLVPFGLFKGSDAWFVLGCAKEKFWRLVASTIGSPELADDERFVDFAARNRNRDELLAILDQVFAAKTASEWVDLLRSAGVPVAHVQSVAEAMADTHTKARELVVETTHPSFGRVYSPASAVRVGDHIQESVRAPLRNEHADDVLRDLLGYTSDQVDALTKDGAFGAVED